MNLISLILIVSFLLFIILICIGAKFKFFIFKNNSSTIFRLAFNMTYIILIASTFWILCYSIIYVIPIDSDLLNPLKEIINSLVTFFIIVYGPLQFLKFQQFSKVYSDSIDFLDPYNLFSVLRLFKINSLLIKKVTEGNLSEIPQQIEGISHLKESIEKLSSYKLYSLNTYFKVTLKRTNLFFNSFIIALISLFGSFFLSKTEFFNTPLGISFFVFLGIITFSFLYTTYINNRNLHLISIIVEDVLSERKESKNNLK